ncbi:MAG: hypothetical protein Q8T08_06670 [Ignavibacteria bacterium]|nr:hypothetical protein [Ignavibacteria bacterium]
MRTSILLILSFIFLTACQKEENIDRASLDGTYKGSFQRIIAEADPMISEVTITFTANRWNGSSNIAKYPALCGGTYLVEEQSVVFHNDCIWTAEFDWSLILAGNYKIEVNGDKIFLYREYYTDGVVIYKDSYDLEKVE